MKLLFSCPYILLVFSMGCGGDDLPQPNRAESYLTVIDNTGTQRDIPASSLIDEEGAPTVKQVFVVDQQSNNRLFLDVSELQGQSPSKVRYVPVTKDDQAGD